MDLYNVDDVSTTSSCVDLDIPDAVIHGHELVIGGTASHGSINALAFDIDDDDDDDHDDDDDDDDDDADDDDAVATESSSILSTHICLALVYA